jgi:hypothetical protein
MRRRLRRQAALSFVGTAVLAIACTKDFALFEGDPDAGPGANEAGIVDTGGGADATIDAPARDGGDSGSCPMVCNGGCSGGTCIIEPNGNATCPPGMPCRFRCNQGDCDPATLTCASGATCAVECSGNGNCDNVTIVRNGASSFCLSCNGNNSCNNVNCGGAAPCSKVCQPGGACNASTCAVCNTVASCN